MVRYLLAIAFFINFNCKHTKEDDSETEGLYRKNVLWGGAKARVCFDDKFPGDAPWRKEVSTIVKAEINDQTHFQFEGFTLCSARPDSEIKVQLLDKATRPNVAGHYSIGDERTPKEKILFHFQPNLERRAMMRLYRRFDTGTPLTPAERHNVTLHEFGHALGLHHEHLRSDVTNCKLSGTEIGHQPTDSKRVGPYDAISIMNYCNPYFWLSPFHLSRGDLATIAEMYGPR